MDIRKRVSAALIFAISAGLVACIGVFVDDLLARQGVPGMQLLLVSNVTLGVITATLFLQHRVRAWERQRLLQERLNTIAQMNHHVRNALAVVAFYGTQVEDICAAQRVSDAVERIEWSLREVLPKSWGADRSNSEDLSAAALDAAPSIPFLTRGGHPVLKPGISDQRTTAG